MSAQNKKVYFTLDLEQDYGRIDDYSSFSNVDELIRLFNKYGLSLTVFVTGKIIDLKPTTIESLNNSIKCEFHLHSYEHEINRTLSAEERKVDLNKAVNAYKKYFRSNPAGWRAPCGDIIKEEIEWLKTEGFMFSSSVIPTYRPGLYNNLGKKDDMFIYPNGLLEIPLSVLPIIKMPFSLSYFQLLGWPISRYLIKKRRNNNHIIFDFHLHNLSKLDTIEKLKNRYRLGYIQNQNNGFKILENFILTMKGIGYKDGLMTELAHGA